ncbi:MAG: hypothetical protein CW716_04350 [Candidatus Bathyarchaeum sp.]|nr:MAG: hypothetical protein CW716_04350 [Candidatus Bathyarchaeum sp.]
MKRFKSAFTILFTLSLTLLAVSCIVQFEVRADEQVFFEDDFESYNAGSFPFSGGWDLWYNGQGDSYQKVVNHTSDSPTKSLSILGWHYRWVGVAARPLETNAVKLGFSVNVRVDSIDVGKLDHSIASVCFGKKIPPDRICLYAPIDFISNGTISVCKQPLQSFLPDTWYNVKSIIDRNTETVSVWIDDVLVADNFTIRTSQGSVTSWPTSEIEGFTVNQFYNSVRAYFDDVKVFAVYDLNPKLVLEPTSGIAATTLVGSGFVPNSEISVTWNDTAIHTVPNPLVTDGYGKFTAIISVLNQTVPGSYCVSVIDELGNEANATFEVVSMVPTSTSEDSSTTNSDDVLELESTNGEPEQTNFDTPVLEIANVNLELESTNADDKPVEEPETAPEIPLYSLLLVAPAVLAVTVIYKLKTPNKTKEN